MRTDSGSASGWGSIVEVTASISVRISSARRRVSSVTAFPSLSLVRAGLSQLSQADLDDTLPGPDFPAAAEGELRVAVIMRDGQLILGGVPIGPAPAI